MQLEQTEMVESLSEEKSPLKLKSETNTSALEQRPLYKRILLGTFKAAIYLAIFIGVSAIFASMSTIHGKAIPEDYFINGYPSILALMNSEFFMGLIFTITLSVIVYVLYLLWTLHEVAVHKTQKVASQHIQVVFALSLCGLFIDKVWWVLAIIIAFTRWDLIAFKLSEIIRHGVNDKPEQNTIDGGKS